MTRLGIYITITTRHVLTMFILSFRFAVYQGMTTASKSDIQSYNPVTVCYVSTWAVYRPDRGKFGIEDLDPNLCTHLVYAFAGLNESTGAIRSLDPFNDLEEDYGKGYYKKMTSLKSQNPLLKVTLAIGGWNEGSEKYSALAASPAKRKVFVESVVVLLKKHNFDGLDLDWEYPGKRGGKPEDKANFVTLIQELRSEMDRHGWILTAAIGAARDTINIAYDLLALNKYLDLIHLMSYDYHGSWDLKIGANAPLTSSKAEDFLTVESSVRYLLANGVSPKKLVLGVPFYGRTFVLENPGEEGNYKTKATGFQGPFTREDGFFGYNEICNELMNGNSSSWTEWWDEETKTPFAKNNDKVIAFDDSRSLKEKVKLAVSHRLAGVMIWSVDTDDFRGDCKETENYDVNSSENSSNKYPLLKTIGRNMAKLYAEQMENDRRAEQDKKENEKDNEVNPNGASKPNSRPTTPLFAAAAILTAIFVQYPLFSLF